MKKIQFAVVVYYDRKGLLGELLIPYSSSEDYNSIIQHASNNCRNDEYFTISSVNDEGVNKYMFHDNYIV